MAIDYGTDITFDGLDILPSLTLTTDSSVVLEALAYRLSVDAGSLWYDTDFGYNINSLFKSPILMTDSGLSSIQTRITQECMKDQRVRKANVDFSNFSLQNQSLTISIQVQLVSGEIPETLVFNLNG